MMFINLNSTYVNVKNIVSIAKQEYDANTFYIIINGTTAIIYSTQLERDEAFNKIINFKND